MKTEDIRITQYALGELTGVEREAFEKEMAADPALLEEVRQTQQFCESISADSEPEAAFTEAERVGLLKRTQVKKNELAEKKAVGGWARVWVYGGLAASLAVLASLSVPAVTGSLERRNKVADLKHPMTEGYQKSRLESVATPVQTVASAVADNSILDGDVSLRGQLFASQKPTEEAKMDSLKAELTRQLNEEPASLAALSAPSIPAAPLRGVSVNLSRAAVAEPQIQVFTGGWGKGSGTGGVAKLKDASIEGVPETELNDARSRSVDGFNTEGYDYQEENRFLNARENPLSTFSIDVDTASYSNIRRFLQPQDQLPPKGAVRIEEMINYFPYNYPQPEGKEPFSVNVETGRAPWNPQHELVRVALKGRELSAEQRPASNLVFLIDVSGSMNQPNKLPLLQKSLSDLTSRLAPKDRVAIVVYAGSSGLVLPSTSNKSDILNALDRLKTGGSTNGGEGIKLAYEQAREHFVEEGNNRVILCTDGDFNVGVTNEQSLVDLIEKQRASGVFLSVLGFGSGNLKDSQMEKLADKGNGNYAYIDSPAEGRKVLVEQMGSTLFTIAKDVKIQVEFNPSTVAGYRLVGYENRLLAKEDFNDDKKDAGEIGAGHTVTAFYEVVPVGQPLPDAPSVDPLKYQKPEKSAAMDGTELLTVKLRYKQPEGSVSQLLEVSVPNEAKDFEKCSTDFQFAAAVAGFGLKLRESKFVGDLSWSEIQKIARANLGEDPGSYRAEFLTLVEKARQISRDREAQKKRDE